MSRSNNWVLARWNGQGWQVVGRFFSYNLAWQHARLITQHTGVNCSIWWEIVDLQWYESEINHLLRKRSIPIALLETLRSGGTLRDIDEEDCISDIRSLGRQISKVVEGAYYLAESRRWNLQGSLRGQRVCLWIAERGVRKLVSA